MTLAPTERSALRLDHTSETFFEDFGRLGRQSVRVKSHAIHLEKMAQLEFPIAQDDSTLLFPGVGLALESSGCLQAHGALRFEPEPCARLEIDLPEQTNGLSFGASPFESGGEPLARMFRNHSVSETDLESLETWRNKMQPSVSMCPCCAKNAARRAQNASQHPIYRIFELAESSKQKLQIRFAGQSVDLTAAIRPTNLEVFGGWIRLASSETVLGMNLYFVHALVLKPGRIDGENVSMMRLYDSHGRELVEISGDAGALVVWQDVCKNESS